MTLRSIFNGILDLDLTWLLGVIAVVFFLGVWRVLSHMIFRPGETP